MSGRRELPAWPENPPRRPEVLDLPCEDVRLWDHLTEGHQVINLLYQWQPDLEITATMAVRELATEIVLGSDGFVRELLCPVNHDAYTEVWKPGDVIRVIRGIPRPN
jgi:hypothetical protein